MATSAAGRATFSIQPGLEPTLTSRQKESEDALWQTVFATSPAAVRAKSDNICEFSKACKYFAQLHLGIKRNPQVIRRRPSRELFPWCDLQLTGNAPAGATRANLDRLPQNSCVEDGREQMNRNSEGRQDLSKGVEELQEASRLAFAHSVLSQANLEWQGQPFDVNRLGSLLKVDSTSVVHEDTGSQASCGVYLYSGTLLFVVDDGGELHILRSFRLLRVTSAYRSQQEHWCSVCVTAIDRHTSTERVCMFAFPDIDHAMDWVSAIETERQKVCPAYREVFPLDADGRTSQHAILLSYPSPALVGVVFLVASPMGEGEYDLGIAISPEAQRQGIATSAVAHALSVAVDKLRAHRVQALVMHSSTSLSAMQACVRWGFTHEGIRRRAIMHPVERQWVDVSVFAVLDSDYVLRQYDKSPAPGTMWDEMFARHQREREELLRWEGRLKRSTSMETVRQLVDTAPSAASSLAGDTSPSLSDAASLSRWDNVSEVESMTERSERLQASSVPVAAADDAADSDDFSTDSWDDFETTSDGSGRL